MISEKKIKVLIVDDSALIRKSLKETISSFDNMEVIGTAADPYIAAHKMKLAKPDVITLDIQMPKMDGITFLRKIMSQHPLPVVVISSLTARESKTALEAYSAGAIDVLEKPIISDELLNLKWKEKLYESLITAANSKVNQKILSNIKTSPEKAENDVTKESSGSVCSGIILIGSSAGGTEVINSILSNLDTNTPPILIVQHMPSKFTQSYAERLNINSHLSVKEASNGDELINGMAFIAPGDFHMELKNNGFNFFISLNKKEKVNRHRPSVDVLFKSASTFRGIKKMGIILSGMGKDGSIGLLELKKVNAITIAQSKESSIVYGMPKEALNLGAASHSMSIEQIIQAIKQFSKQNS